MRTFLDLLVLAVEKVTSVRTEPFLLILNHSNLFSIVNWLRFYLSTLVLQEIIFLNPFLQTTCVTPTLVSYVGKNSRRISLTMCK